MARLSRTPLHTSSRVREVVDAGVNDFRERRQHPRVPYYESVYARSIQPPAFSRYLLAEDLSEGGMRLLSPDMCALGVRLVLDIEPDQVAEPIRVVGRVVWVERAAYQAYDRLGVELVDVCELQRLRLRALVADQGMADANLASWSATAAITADTPASLDGWLRRRPNLTDRTRPPGLSSQLSAERPWR
jgi:hypothetical protein